MMGEIEAERTGAGNKKQKLELKLPREYLG